VRVRVECVCEREGVCVRVCVRDRNNYGMRAIFRMSDYATYVKCNELPQNLFLTNERVLFHAFIVKT
jgi:hypothetical protein